EPYAHEPQHGSWSPPAPRRPDPSEESWTDKLLRERFAGRSADPGRGREDAREYERGRADTRPARPDPIRDEDMISGLHAGDRWASVRSDDRGRELRMGERRAAVHSDHSGTELRIEDRWAAVRREDAAVRREDAAVRREDAAVRREDAAVRR